MDQFGVIYYTRTNNSKRVAEKIAKKLSCDLIQCTDHINWQGLFGYLKAGFYSMSNKHIDVELYGTLDVIDEYIIVGPYWAGGLAPAFKTLLNQFPRDKVHLVVTSLGSQINDRSGYLSVHDITKNSGNEDAVIDGLVHSLLSN